MRARRCALHIIEGAIVGVNDRKAGYIKFYKNPRESLWGATDAGLAGLHSRLGATSTEIEVLRLDSDAPVRAWRVRPFGADLCDGWMTRDEMDFFEMYGTFGDH